MPTSVLRNKSPFECLFHQPPDYSFLHTFECFCFSFLRPYNAHKLDFCSTPCVFLGYSSCHLGYCCLDLSCDRVYISRHVRFYEQSFPFPDTNHVSAIPDSNPQPTSTSHFPALTHFPSHHLTAKTPSSFPKQVPIPPVATMSIDYFTSSGSAALI
jgi:histone deacetylase 1/2